jgi:predicted Zn-dependent peptidase
MGIYIDVGTRDETHENSGSLLALNQTYLKTLKHTNETINYGMIQMSGGDCIMEYDEESVYYSASCFEYDVTDIFRMMGDLAFEPRSILSANVAKDKCRSYFKLKQHLHHYHPFSNNPQNFLTTAYGLNTLGMPRDGFESNVESIDAKVLQDFQTSNITPSKVIVCANGVHNHKEFVDLVEETIGVLNPVRESEYSRKPSEYIGGEYRVFTESPETNIILGYKSVPWNHELMPAFAVLHMLFGSATGFSVGGPGKGMLNRSHTQSINIV